MWLTTTWRGKLMINWMRFGYDLVARVKLWPSSTHCVGTRAPLQTSGSVQNERTDHPIPPGRNRLERSRDRRRREPCLADRLLPLRCPRRSGKGRPLAADRGGGGRLFLAGGAG